MKPLLLAAILLTVAAKAPKPPQEIGPEPTYDNWKKIVSAKLDKEMYDFPSARIEWGSKIVRHDDGWYSCFGSNAKNQFGAYTGWHWGLGKVRSDAQGQNVMVYTDISDHSPWNAAECEAILARDSSPS